MNSDKLKTHTGEKSIVVVLGMHRSGTSAITRGLQALGVDLGERLMLPAAGNNDKGFFEDIDINAINIELLKELGQDWHTLSLISADELLHEKYASLRLRAIELLRSRLQETDRFGIKDPRLCRLLPFWQKVFEHLRVDVSYIIAIRNPLSVAKSLEARNKLPPEKSHYLWLGHVLPSVLLTQGMRRVVVDYDLLLDNPQQQMSRMALGLGGRLDPARVAEFSRDFLDNRLRHTGYKPEDVLESPVVPYPVRTAVMLLAEVAADRLSLDSEEVAGVFGNLAGQMAGMAQAMDYLLRLDNIIAGMSHALAERNSSADVLNRGIAERDSRIAALTEAIKECKACMTGLTQGMAERDDRIEMLSQAVEERKAQVVALGRDKVERDGRIEALKQTVEKRESQIAALSQRVAERDNQIAASVHEAGEQRAQMAQSMAERDSHVAALKQAAEERQAQLAALTQNVAERDVWIEELTRMLEERKAGTPEQGTGERDGQAEALKRTIEEHRAQMAALTQGMAERDEHIAELTQATEERDEHIAELAQMVEERDEQVSMLSQGVTERDSRIEALLQDGVRQSLAVQQLRIEAAQRDHRLEQVQSSLGWKILKPVRAARGLLPGIGRKIGVALAPLDRLQRSGDEWLSAGGDGQFMMMAESAWQDLAGWHWLDMDSAAGQLLKARLVFDIGGGFDASRAIDLRLSGNGAQRVPLFVPHGCSGVRLDLFEMPARFGLAAVGLGKLARAPKLPAEYLAQSAAYRALGWQEGDIPAFEPVNSVQRHDEADYCWRSDGDDPWFVLPDIGRKLRPGWYMIELRICSDAARGNAKLYFDCGEGYSEWASVTLPFRSGQESKRLYYLSSAPRQVRFDPLEAVARFSVERLHFAPVSSVFAYHRMLRRLQNRHAHYRDMSLGTILQDLRAQGKTKKITARDLLCQRYNHTFRIDSGQAGIGDGYEEWIAKVEAPEFSCIDALTALPASFKLRPMISVVMPVYNTPEAFLRQAVESVLAQGYPYWELCIADDASTEPHVRTVLEEYMQRDPRIKTMFREENGHISAASNSALALATGEYVALLDHDDELARHALHLVAEAINRNPSAQVLYSDEDKIDEQGSRSDPHFKSDWNPDLFFSQNYVSHLGVYRRELLQRTGGFRIGVEGSQDQDLLLRCLPHVKPAEIVHIPKVLYHWRITEGSTARACGEKGYTTEAGVRVLQDFFRECGREDVKVENGLAPNTYRIRYPVPQPEPLVSLLIPTRDKLELLEPCIRSILGKTTYGNYEIVILDNESTQPATLEFFRRIQAEDRRVRVLAYHRPFNYSAINNFGVRESRGELIGLVNNDIEVISPDWLTEMASHALRPEIGCVGAKLYYDDETLQHAGVIVGLGGVAGHSHKYFPRESPGYFHRLKIIQNLSAVTAACLVVRKSVYEQVGGLEEDGLRVAFNDVDFCLKVREAGYRNLWTPYAELFHYESKSRGEEDTPEKVERFNREIEFVKAKWGDLLRRDPCYSPNLTLAREDFSLEGA